MTKFRAKEILAEIIEELTNDIEDHKRERHRFSSESYDWWSVNQTLNEFHERLELYSLLRDALERGETISFTEGDE